MRHPSPFSRNLRQSQPVFTGIVPTGSPFGREREPPGLAAGARRRRRRQRECGAVELERIAWLVTVLACLVTVLILVLQGYYGYAGVTLAVAVSAFINLF